ncbi:MAG: NADH:ubiquinone oxidoreductase subunit 1 [Methanophagales archaeon]|nr:NADH:ubiquinone oxidoreductase subunit 1 [Methanophagales archaeon]
MYFAYEIPFIICVIAMLILYGTGDTVSIVNMQSVPGAILNPVAALAFAIAMVMATSRLPFEIPEADQELAFGPMVEYSGIVFGLVMTLAYEKAYVMAALMTDLFFMGGAGPEIPMLGDLSGAIWFFIKVLIIIVVVFSLRAIYPRYRIDQALRIGWTFSLALSLLALAISLCLVASGIAPSVTAAEVVAP